MSDEDLYMNSGLDYAPADYQPSIPKERVEEESKEAAIKAASYPIIGAVADWFQEQFDYLDSRSALLAYAKEYNIDVEVAGRAFDVARDIIAIKTKEFEDFQTEKDV